MILSIKKRYSSEWIFLITLFIYVTSQLIQASTLGYILPSALFVLIRFGVLVATTLSIVARKKHSKKYVMAMLVIVAAIMAMVAFGEYLWALAIPLFLVLASDGTDYKCIIKCVAFAIIFATVLVILMCALHAIPDYTYTHRVGNVIKVAHSWGFKYYSSLGYVSMALTAMYLYLHDDISFFKLSIIAIFNYFLFLVHTTQLSLLLSVIFLVAYVFTRKLNLLNFNNKFWKVVSTIIPSLLCLGTIWLVELYNKNALILSLQFSTLTSRLKYSVQAIDQYGISLFGSEVTMYGNTQKYYGNATSGFYIDSGFLYSLIAYGIIFTVLIIFIYTLIYRYIASSGDSFLFVWLSVILVACVVNNFLLNCYFNPIIFLLPYALRNSFENKHQGTS